MKGSFGVCTLMRAQLRDTHQFINYYLNAGASHLFLFFDDPDDPAVASVSSIRGVSTIRCNAQWWQRASSDAPSSIRLRDPTSLNTKIALASFTALRMATNHHLEWLLVLDSDELIFPPDEVRRQFRETPEDISVIRLPPMEASPPPTETTGAFLGSKLFKKGQRGPPPKEFLTDPWERLRETLDVRSRRTFFKVLKMVARLMGLGRVFHFGYFKGHVQGKSAVRIGSGVEWVRGHYPSPPDIGQLRLRTARGLWLLHYDCQGYVQWKMKWERRALGKVKITPSRRRSAQLDEIGRLVRDRDEEGLRRLFGDLYHLNSYEERVLRILGLLVEIRLPEEAFDRPRTRPIDRT